MLHFLAGCHNRFCLSYLLTYIFSVCCCSLRLIFAYGYFASVCVLLLVVLVNFQYLPSDWLERLQWGSVIVARGSSPQSPGRRVFTIFLVQCVFHCLIAYLSCPPDLPDIVRTPVARYSLFVLKVMLNTNELKQTLGKLLRITTANFSYWSDAKQC